MSPIARRISLIAAFLLLPVSAIAGPVAVGRQPVIGTTGDAQVTATGSTTARRLRDRFSDTVNAKDNGAKGDGVTDDTVAIQAAVTIAGQAYAASPLVGSSNPNVTSPQVVSFKAGATYKIATGPVLVPSGVIVEANGATFIGPSAGSGTLFESGYFSGATVVTNWGTAPESHLVEGAIIRNARMKDCAIAIRVQNWNRGSVIENVVFYNCKQAVKASRSFYGVFRNLRSVWPVASGATPGPMYQWTTTVGATDSANNAMTIAGLSCDGGGVLSLCYQLDGGTDGLGMRDITAENAVNGIKFLNDVVAFTLGGGSSYFENLSGTAIDFTDSFGHRGIVIDGGVRFYQCAVGIDGVLMVSGRIGPGIFFRTEGTGVPVKVRINDDTTSYITVEVPPTGVNTNGTPALPAGFTLGKGVKVVFPFYTFNNSDGKATTRQNYTGGLIDLPWSGNAGHIPGDIPYATTVVNNGTGTVTVTTSIVFDNYAAGYVSINIADFNGSYQFNGKWYNSSTAIGTPEVVWDRQPGGGIVGAISNVGGFVTFTFTGLATGHTMSYEGAIRMY